MINLVLDVNVILDMWLSRGDTTAIDALLEHSHASHCKCWVSACSLPIIDYVFIASLKSEGALPAEAKKIARQLLAELLNDVSVLCSYEPSQSDWLVVSSDMEDVQIALAAANLPGEVFIITRDKQFDTQGQINAFTPEQMLQRLELA